MAMCSFSTSYCNSSALSRIDPSYNTPNALGTISVYVNKIGNVSYYVAKRYLGLLSGTLEKTFAPLSIATNSTFIDSSLNANTKYTYAFIATDSNGYSASANVPTTRGGNGDGSIYTLAPPLPSSLTLTYNGGSSSLTTAAFDYSFTTVSGNNTGLSIKDYNGNVVQTVAVAASGSGTYTSISTIAGSTTNKNTIYTYNVYVLNAAGVGSGISVCNKTINTCTWADISSVSFVLPNTLNRIYNSSLNASFTNFVGSATSCTFTRSGGSQIGFTSSIQSINNCIDSSFCDANTQYTYYLTPYNQLNYGGTNNYTSIINQARTTSAYYGKIYSLWDPSSITLTYLGSSSTTTTVVFSCSPITYIKFYDYAFNVVTSSTSTATIAGVATTPNTIYRYYAIGQNSDLYYSTNIIACAAYVDTCTRANITYAEYVELDTLNAIYNSSLTASITNITGNYDSFTFGRSIIPWNSATYVYSTNLQTGNNCIDTSTDLIADAAYTYQLYPYNKLGYGKTLWLDSFCFSSITNKNRYTNTALTTLVPITGNIYTLAGTSSITIQPNTSITTTIIAVSVDSTSGNCRLVPYESSTYYAEQSTVAATNYFQVKNKSPNTIYNVGFYILNGDLIGKNISGCFKSIDVCTLSDITGKPTFCYTNTQKRIYNSSTDSTITDITGNYSYYIVTRTGGTQGTYTSPQQTTSTFIDSATNLTSNTAYVYWIYSYNKLDVVSTKFTTVLNGANYSSSIRTMADPSCITITSSLAAAAGSTILTLTVLTFTSNTTYGTYGTYALFDSAGTKLTLTSNTYTLPNVRNTIYTFTLKIYSNDGGYASPETYFGAIQTYNVCTTASFSNCNFVKPIALGSITDSNSASLTGVTYNCAYYNITRTGGTQGTVVSDNINVDNSPLSAGTVTNSIFTGLNNNSQYTFVIAAYNKSGDKYITSTTITNPNNSTTPGKIYTLATPTSCVVDTTISCTYISQLLRKPITFVNNGYKQVYFYTNATSSGPYINTIARLGPYTTQTSASINVASGTTRPAIPSGAAITLMVDNGDTYGNAISACMTSYAITN